MVRQSSARAEVGGSRTLRQQDLEKGSENSLEIQRRVFLNVISSYLNRPEELNNNSPPDNKYNPQFLKDRSHWNKDTSIHLRVIRSPGRSFYFRRRVPPPPIEKGMLLGSNQLGDVVLELREVSSPNPAGNIRRNMSDGQVVIKDLPMVRADDSDDGCWHQHLGFFSQRGI